MLFLHVALLSIIQGISEFLPISSSGHLVLAHVFVGDGVELTATQEKMLDVAVHVGTLLAVFIYFRKELLMLIRGGIQMLLTRRIETPEEILVAKVLMASVAIFPVGFVLSRFDPSIFDSVEIIGWTMLVFGILLGVADARPATKSIDDLSLKSAFWLGVLQTIALIPGVSRSGITMTGARYFGLSRGEAARFSMLMAMVSTSGAGAIGLLEVAKSGSADLVTMASIGIPLTFITALAVIWGMMRFFTHHSGTMRPFVIYRVLLGMALLIMVYGGFIPQEHKGADPVPAAIQQTVLSTPVQ